MTLSALRTSEELIRLTTPPPLQKFVCLKRFNEEDIKKKMANYVKKNGNGLTWGLETPLPHTTKCLLHYVIGHIFCENLLNNHIYFCITDEALRHGHYSSYLQNSSICYLKSIKNIHGILIRVVCQTAQNAL